MQVCDLVPVHLCMVRRKGPSFRPLHVATGLVWYSVCAWKAMLSPTWMAFHLLLKISYPWTHGLITDLQSCSADLTPAGLREPHMWSAQVWGDHHSPEVRVFRLLFLTVLPFLSPLNFRVNFRTSLLILHKRGWTSAGMVLNVQVGVGGTVHSDSTSSSCSSDGGRAFRWSGAYPVAFSNAE